MAALTSSGVTFDKSWEVPGNPVRTKVRQVTLVLDSQGGATNSISASVLGLTKIYRSSMAQKSDNALALHTCPSVAGTLLFFYNPADGTDATRDDPVDVTGTFTLTVEGY